MIELFLTANAHMHISKLTCEKLETLKIFHKSRS